MTDVRYPSDDMPLLPRPAPLNDLVSCLRRNARGLVGVDQDRIEAASAIEALQSEVDELRSERKWMGKVIDERDDKIRQLRLIANVNGDWNIKYGEAINRAEAADLRIKELEAKLERRD